MNKEKTLLIMAAGMGSRFGGLKQIEPIGPNGEFLIDYSIYDAVQEGFTKVVFVIKKENETIFKETVGNRVSKSIKVEYAFQDINDLPTGYTVPEGREKPWGTAHAILAAKNYINEPFVIINADDFYGRDAYKVVSTFLDEAYENNSYCVVGYLVKNTLSENGSVKRAVCIEDNGKLVELIESSIIKEDGIITAAPLDGRVSMELMENNLVSMNMLGFNATLFKYIEDNFKVFLNSGLKSNPLKCEYLIPDVIYQASKDNYAKVSVLSTDAVWYGVTYKEDKEYVVSAIKKLIDNGEYPNNLWN